MSQPRTSQHNSRTHTADPGAKPPAAPGRDAQGRFAPGNAGGPGNPFARQVAALRAALVRTVTEQDIEQIAQDLVVQAKAGNLAATKLLFQYVLGKPAEAVNPDTLDVQEWQEVYRPLPEILQELPAAMQTLPAATACAMAQAAQPFVGGVLADALRLPPEGSEEIAKRSPDAGARPQRAQERPSPNGCNGQTRQRSAPRPRPSRNGRHSRRPPGQGD
jgi:hypothetical protein